MEAWLGLIGVLVGSAIASLTGLLAHRYQVRRDGVIRREQRLADLRALYQDAIVVLDRTSRAAGEGTTEELNEMVRLRARLALGSTEAIRTQFDTVGAALDACAEEARAAQPQRLGATAVMIGSHQQQFRVKAEKLFPAFEEGFEQLQDMMRDHIQQMDADLA
jgi:hypothetical protein